MNPSQHNSANHGRRAFLKNGSLFLLGGGIGSTLVSNLTADEMTPKVTVGLVTDLHYADKPAAGSRHYRDTPKKLAAAAEQFRKSRPDFLVELGDLIDAADSVKTELGYLKRINRDFSAICDKRHYVLGNHCVHTLNKQEFLDGVERRKSYYSFDEGGFHFIVLDACFRSDGTPYGRKNFKWTDPNLPAKEVDWLKSDLKSAKGTTIVFTHQRLDVANHYGVKNAKAVRKLLEDSGKVRAVFQGHSHRNDVREIGGIHYCTLVAMVEGAGPSNNGFSLMNIAADGTIRLDGFRKQKDYTWKSSR